MNFDKAHRVSEALAEQAAIVDSFHHFSATNEMIGLSRYVALFVVLAFLILGTPLSIVGYVGLFGVAIIVNQIEKGIRYAKAEYIIRTNSQD